MRAKFHCNSVAFHGDPENPDTTRTYHLNAVTDNRTAENERYHRYTPFGELKLTIDNPAAQLNPGEDYYLDITPCATAQAAAPETMGNTHDIPDGAHYQPAHSGE